MSDSFDPYFSWLGIPPHERPVNHYRLLGLALFESDEAAIRQAADERMVRVRSHQTGPRGALTQPLLNQLAAAKLCLLEPASKAAYDAELSGRQAACTAAGVPDFVPATLAPPVAQVAEPPAVGVPATPPATASSPVSIAPPPQPPGHPAADAVRRPESLGKPSGDPADSASPPFYFRAWFPVAVCAGIASVAILVWGIDQWRTHRPVRRGPKDISDKTIVEFVEVQPEPPIVDEGPVVVQQESTGDVNLVASVARLDGENLQLVDHGANSCIAGWKAGGGIARWRFRVIEAGPFQVKITYALDDDAAGSRVRLTLNDQEKICELRASSGPDRFVTDEYFFFIRRSGEQEMMLGAESLPDGAAFQLQAIQLIPRGGLGRE